MIIKTKHYGRNLIKVIDKNAISNISNSRPFLNWTIKETQNNGPKKKEIDDDGQSIYEIIIQIFHEILFSMWDVMSC